MDIVSRRGPDRRTIGLPQEKPYSRELVRALESSFERISDYILPELQKLQTGDLAAEEKKNAMTPLVKQLEGVIEDLKVSIGQNKLNEQDKSNLDSIEGSLRVFKAFLDRLEKTGNKQ